jgi:integrase
MASVTFRENRGKWQARYRDPAGRERAGLFDRKADAKRWLDEQTAAIVTGQYVAPEAGRMTFRTFAEDWRARQVHRPTTAAKVENTLRVHAYPAFGERPLGAIMPSHIEAWVKGLSLRLAPATIAVSHGIVAGVFKAAVRDRRIASSPCEGTRLPEVFREPVVPLLTEQVLALEEAMPPRYRAFVPLAAATGLRQGELFGLTLDASGLRPPSARPRLRVERQLLTLAGEPPYLGPPKRKASRREVPLPRVAVEALAAHLAAFPAVPLEVPVRDHGGRLGLEVVELVFTNRSGRPVRRNGFGDVWRAATRAAGVEATPHDLRHYYASLLIRHGENVKVVQARLGHATAAETLDTYAHLWPDSEDRTRDAIDSMLGAAFADHVRTRP